MVQRKLLEVDQSIGYCLEYLIPSIDGFLQLLKPVRVGGGTVVVMGHQRGVLNGGRQAEAAMAYYMS